MLETLLDLFIVYMYGSATEWCLHAHVLHGLHKNSIEKAHAIHHKTYPANRFNDCKDDQHRFNNLVLCLEHIFAFILPAAGLAFLAHCNVLALILLVFGLFHYITYNQIHSAMHLNHKVWWLPKWAFMIISHNHFMHHQHPSKWYCVSLPGFDYLVGTTCKMTEADKLAWEKVKEAQLKDNMTDNLKEIKKLNNCIVSNRYLLNGYVSRFSGLLNPVVEGEPVIYYANHISWRDPLILGLHLKARTAVHVKVMNFLWMGLILGPLYGFFSVGRGKGEAVQACVKLLKEYKQPLLIFPEGVTNLSNQPLRPFKTGIVRIIEQVPEAKVIPVKIEYDHYMPAWIEKLPYELQFILTLFHPHAYSPYRIYIGVDL